MLPLRHPVVLLSGKLPGIESPLHTPVDRSPRLYRSVTHRDRHQDDRGTGTIGDNFRRGSLCLHEQSPRKVDRYLDALHRHQGQGRATTGRSQAALTASGGNGPHSQRVRPLQDLYGATSRAGPSSSPSPSPSIRTGCLFVERMSQRSAGNSAAREVGVVRYHRRRPLQQPHHSGQCRHQPNRPGCQLEYRERRYRHHL